LPLLLGGSKGDQQWIDRVIDTVGLRPRLKHRPSELSGGQQQRVAVAALASKPTITSPTSRPATSTAAPAPRSSPSCAPRRELGQTIVMVTHDPVAASYADRVVFLADGKIVDEMPSRRPTVSSTA
jgi:putative ABC transport system ATP-binding protein